VFLRLGFSLEEELLAIADGLQGSAQAARAMPADEATGRFAFRGKNALMFLHLMALFSQFSIPHDHP